MFIVVPGNVNHKNYKLIETFINSIIPKGSMNRVTLGSMLFPDSRQRIVQGSVAVLEAVPIAQIRACSIFLAKRMGFLFVKTYRRVGRTTML